MELLLLDGSLHGVRNGWKEGRDLACEFTRCLFHREMDQGGLELTEPSPSEFGRECTTSHLALVPATKDGSVNRLVTDELQHTSLLCYRL